MAKTNHSFIELLSRERLKLWSDGSRDPADGRHELADRLLLALDVGDDACWRVFAEILPNHFYNMTAGKKRQFFDGIAVACCENAADADALFDLFRKEKWPGRTRTPSET
jgi:hypothetical protein